MQANAVGEVHTAEVIDLVAGDVLRYQVNGTDRDSYTVPAGKTAKIFVVIDGNEKTA